MHDIEQLIREHEHLDDLAGQILELTALPQPQAEEAFALLRHIALLMDDHLAVERDFLTPAANKPHAAKLANELRAFDEDFRLLMEEWSTYLQEWTIENIEIDWRNFDHASQWVIGQMRARIARENDLLYPLALHFGQIRLRDPATPAQRPFTATGADI